MGGSPAEAPTTPDAEPVGLVRASDAERDEVLSRLREEFAAGRLSHDTFLIRMDAVLQARHVSDLPPLLADLGPGTAAPGVPVPDPAAPVPDPAAPDPPRQRGPFLQVAPPSLTGRLRAALDRWLRTGLTWPVDPAGRPRTAAPRNAAPRTAAPRTAAPRTAAPRTAAPRTAAPRTAVPRNAAPRTALRLTSGMTRAAEDPRPPFRRGARGAASPEPGEPVPLQFPRGAGTFFSIGRDAGCDLAIGDMTVSRMHARLERTGDGWLLTDLASTNGTRVNGWLVRGDVRVRAGDLVSFGKAEFWLAAPEAT